jgi:hypothetical protein
MGTDREATDDEFDGDALLEEISNLFGRDCGKLTKERGSLDLEVQHMGSDRQARVCDLDDTALVEGQFNFAREGFKYLTNEGDSFSKRNLTYGDR